MLEMLNITLSLPRSTIVGPELIIWSVFVSWSWKYLCISKEKMVPSDIYDVVYHLYNLWNIFGI